MAKTYQQYLAENGATSEEIAVLATPKAIAAYNKMTQDFEAEKTAALTAAEQQFNAQSQEWWDGTYNPALKEKEAEILRLTGENERSKAVLKKANEMGLTQLAIDAGHDPAPNPANPNPAANPAGFDPKKYVAVEDFQNAYSATGKAIAQAAQIQSEHFALFGTFPADMEEMLEVARASKGQKNLRAVWEEKHKVADKKRELETKKQEEHDNKIRTEHEAKIRAEYSQNPNMRHAATSRNSFTQRPAENGGKKFFEIDPNAAKKARIEKFAGKVQ